MSTFIVMLIYEIVGYKYEYRFDSQCCEHNWVFDGKGTGCGASCSLAFFSLSVSVGGNP